ncbi:MAG: cyclic nucleotide-binding domain-containing protein [Alphaproteobacteria bacterium]|nr:cyclic nucleotide-binding domain-containing protein [Alphaproteobacteria bacterium]
MSGIANTLARLDFLAHVPLPMLQASVRYWSLRELGPGEVLAAEGDAPDALAIVLSGRLRAQVGGTPLSDIGPGELVGEVAAFLKGATISATLTVLEPTELAVLRIPSLLALRRRGSPIYRALLDAALRTLCDRVRRTDARITELCQANRTALPERPSPDDDSAPPEPPALAPLLRGLPGLQALTPAQLDQLVAAFRPVAVRDGDALVSEGQPGDSAFVIACGRVQVVRGLGEGRDGWLTTLGPGDPFGFNALIDDGPRSASCRAAGAGWVYRMSSDAFDALGGDLRLAWQESLLATLATQLRLANAIVSATQGGGVEVPDFRRLLQASGALEGLSLAGTDALEPASAADPLGSPS